MSTGYHPKMSTGYHPKSDAPAADQGWDRAVRDETPTERLDRNWNSLLQELRVTQTGVQLLTGFLLVLPFQPQFGHLSTGLRGTYLATVVCSLAATILLIAPVGMHRVLFRRHRLKVLVSAAHKCAYTGLLLLGVALTGVAILIFGAVLGGVGGTVAGVVTGSAMLAGWVLVPVWLRKVPMGKSTV
jgi:hypothetical protein